MLVNYYQTQPLTLSLCVITLHHFYCTFFSYVPRDSVFVGVCLVYDEMIISDYRSGAFHFTTVYFTTEARLWLGLLGYKLEPKALRYIYLT